MKYIGIKTDYKAFYCDRCKTAMKVLYIGENKEKFCKNCIDKEDITGLVYMSQNREIIK